MSDAGATDAGAADAAPADALTPADPELLRHQVAERDLAAQAEEAAREEREADEAQARALAEQTRAESEAELLLSTERARLEAVRSRQAEYRRRQVQDKSDLTSRARSQLTLVKDVHKALAEGGDFDRLWDRVDHRLTDALAAGIDDIGNVIGGPDQPPYPPTLASAVVELAAERASDLGSLRALRERLRQRADELADDADALLADRIALHHQITRELAPLRARLLNRVSAAKHDQVLGLTEDGPAGARDEVVLMTLQVAHWLYVRAGQLRHRFTTTEDWLSVGAALWSVIELLILLFALRLALRRWDQWMTGLIASFGRAMHLGTGALWAARLAELARSFGPPLLVTATAVVAYLRLGNGLPEVVVGFTVVFWLGIFHTQLRLVQGLAHAIGTRRAERAAQARELEQEEEGAPAPPAPSEPDDLEPVWKTVQRSWRVGTRYIASAFILLELIELSSGRAVLHSLTSRVAWWGAVPLAIYLLHIWRPRVVHQYLQRTGSREGFLGKLAARHAHRFYGLVIVAPALVVVLARQTVGFVRRHLSNLDSTKRLFAWLFRRRVEKHAQELGRVLSKPQELPPELIAEFPVAPLGPDDRPTSPSCMDEIAEHFAAWQNNGTDGTLAVVGAAGIGKTTTLRLLEKKLGEPVMYAKLITKVTRPSQLFGRLTRLLELEGEASTEAEMVSMLRDQPHRVIALDNCHNLFLRQVGGFEAWETFARLVNESSDKIFWVCSFNDVCWDYLNSIAARVSYFRRVIRLQGWSDVELRRLILSRMRRARFRTSFTDLLVTRLEGVSMSSQIIGTSHGYFRLLWDFTNGNPRDATHFWLHSLVPTEDRRVRVHLFSAPRIEELQKLPDDIVFVLQAIIEHDNLTVDELTRVTNMAPEFCRFAMRYCRDAGYLFRDPDTGRSQVSIHWHQVIVRFLKRQHLIYS